MREPPTGLTHAPTLSFTTRPGLEGFEAWREAFALKVARVDVTPPDRTAFRAEILVRPLPGVTLSQNRFDACSLMRTPELVRDGDDAVSLVLCLEGRFDVRFGDDAVGPLPGQALLMPNHRLGGVNVGPGARTYTLRMERDVAGRIVPSVEATLLRATAPGDPAFALLGAYCAQLVTSPGALPATTAKLAGTQLEELMAHLLGNRDAIDIAEGSGVRAARLCAIKNDIARNLARRDLSTATIAERHRMTPRHVQRLLESDGTTFTAYLLAQRLACVHRLLKDPRRACDKISTLAFEAGFHDLSHFARAFRQRYGDTPSGVRTSAPSATA